MFYTDMCVRKMNREDERDGRRYVKKPPNAFMLYMREQRPKYVAAMKGSGTAGVTRILGDKWKLLSSKEQEKYYEQAHREKLLHAQQHPDWSASDNYGQKRKRNRRKASKTEESAWIYEEVTSPVKKMRGTPRYSGGTVVSRTQSAVMKPSTWMESNLLARDKDISMDEQLEICPPPAPLTQPLISMFEWDMGYYRPGAPTSMDSPAALDEYQRAECSHLAGVGHPHMAKEFSLLEMVESLPPMLHPQQSIPAAVESLTTEREDFAGVEDLTELQLVYKADQNLTTDPDLFVWMEDVMPKSSMLELHESPLSFPKPQIQPSEWMVSPVALDDNNRAASNHLAGVKQPRLKELRALLEHLPTP